MQSLKTQKDVRRLSLRSLCKHTVALQSTQKRAGFDSRRRSLPMQALFAQELCIFDVADTIDARVFFSFECFNKLVKGPFRTFIN